MNENISRELTRLYRPSWAEIDLKALRHNFRQLKKTAGKKTGLLAVIKADAYGHGLVEAAKVLNKEDVVYFGVSSIVEGITLRGLGVRKPILLFGNILKSYIPDLFKYRLTATVSTLSLARAINAYAQKTKKYIPVHIKVDTGMGRLGIWQEEAFELIQDISRLPYLHLEGIYTHFSVADTNREFTKQQICRFARLIQALELQGIVFLYIHAANSAGLVDYPGTIFNLARPGLMLYGLYPDERLKKKIHLKPVMSIKSKITFLKEILKGRSVSYGRTYIANGKRKIATLPIGYNDGYLRCFSNQAFVLVNGQRCPVAGRVTMDQIMIDVTKAGKVQEGTEVVILGVQQKSVVSADELAEKAGTINYEIVCSLGNRLPRIYKK